jgi:hypothetical protein
MGECTQHKKASKEAESLPQARRGRINRIISGSGEGGRETQTQRQEGKEARQGFT